MKLVFASNNKNKIIEMQKLLPNDIQLLSLEDIGCFEDIEETATTIEGNAILKANHVTFNYGYDCFADDSGLEVAILDGAPGVHSARYAGEERNDENNINKLLNALEGKTSRKAHFKTVIALNLNGKQQLFRELVYGEIITKKRGNQGFGYDPVFLPNGFSKTFAEISLEEKNKISHRGKATLQLINFLKN